MFYPSDTVVFCFTRSLSVFQDYSKDPERQVTTANDLMETRLNGRIFDKKTYLFFMAKYITAKTVLKVFSPRVLDKLSYDLPQNF